MAARRIGAILITLVTVLGACGPSAPASAPASEPAGSVVPTASLAPPAPSMTPAPDVVTLLAERFAAVTSGEVALAGTLVVGNVQATFTGSSRSNGPDEASTFTTTVGGRASTDERVQLGGTRYLKRTGGPWLIDTSPARNSDLDGALKRAIGAAKDLDAGETGAANHRVEAANQPFDPAALGFATQSANGTATYAFLSKVDGTPVSVSIKATWRQPAGEQTVDASVDLTLTFVRMNTKPSISTPSPVWQTYVSDRWAYSVAYPHDYDHAKEKEADYFFAPSYGLVSVTRVDAEGYTLNEIAQATLAQTKKAMKAGTATNEAATLGGVKGRLLTLAGTNEGVKVTVYELLALKGKFVYDVFWFSKAGDDAAALATFSQMVASFAFR